MHTELVKLANHLDKLGHGDLADRIDMLLKEALSEKGKAALLDLKRL